MDAFPVSHSAEVVGTDHDDDHLASLLAVARRGDRRRRLMLSFLEKAALNSGDREAPFRETRRKRVRRPSLGRIRGTRHPRLLSSPSAAARPARATAAAAAAAPAAADSPRITLEHFWIDMRVDEVLPLHEQALYPASGGVPFLPGVEEFVRAKNKAGVRMALATSSPMRLLEAESAGQVWLLLHVYQLQHILARQA
jgi:hypothetical protein